MANQIDASKQELQKVVAYLRNVAREPYINYVISKLANIEPLPSLSSTSITPVLRPSKLTRAYPLLIFTMLLNKNITKFLINARYHFIYCWRFGITFFRMTRMNCNHEFSKCTVPKRDRYRFSSNQMDQKQTVLATLDSTGKYWE